MLGPDPAERQTLSGKESPMAKTTFAHSGIVRGPQQVAAEAAEYFGVSLARLISRDRSHPLVHQRQVAIAATRAVGGDAWSYPTIARVYRLDHSTVLSSCRRVADDPDLSHQRDELAARFVPRIPPAHPDVVEPLRAEVAALRAEVDQLRAAVAEISARP